MVKVQQEGDVVDLILEQHKQIRQLFSRVVHTEGEERARTFEELTHLLEIHEQAEERVVHPVTKDVARGVAEARVHEEDEAKKMLKQLKKMGPDADGFDDLFQQLKHAVDEHATQEQREEFPKLREKCDEDQLREMAEKFRKVQATGDGRRKR
ncbi:hemerythrin domain-containing protein [Sphaerimonospora mesophila]|uniref:hemerythrin domain-containing protein n=1 Tax=Sphaerimonospora mesophila TaxID=37483 RepID=UPI0006E177C7